MKTEMFIRARADLSYPLNPFLFFFFLQTRVSRVRYACNSEKKFCFVNARERKCEKVIKFTKVIKFNFVEKKRITGEEESKGMILRQDLERSGTMFAFFRRLYNAASFEESILRFCFRSLDFL